MLKFEASVKQFHHVPLRVTVDRCVATVVPNIDTVPRYSFLGNSGSVSSTAFILEDLKATLAPTMEAWPSVKHVTANYFFN